MIRLEWMTKRVRDCCFSDCGIDFQKLASPLTLRLAGSLIGPENFVATVERRPLNPHLISYPAALTSTCHRRLASATALIKSSPMDMTRKLESRSSARSTFCQVEVVSSLRKRVKRVAVRMRERTSLSGMTKSGCTTLFINARDVQ